MTDLVRRADRVLDVEVRPFIQAHGGNVAILSATAGVVEVEFSGACAACDIRPVTFASLVRRKLLAIEDVNEVICSTVLLSPGRLAAISKFFDAPADES